MFAHTQIKQRSRVRVLLAWLIILAVVGLVSYSNTRSARSYDTQELVAAEQARMAGMLALQMKSLQKGDSGSALIQQQVEQLIRQLDTTSRTTEDKIRLSILVGENIGPEAALMRLKELERVDNSEEVAADIRTLHSIYEDSPETLAPADRERLIRRFGYLGLLASAYGVPADQEPRKTLVTQAFWFTLRVSLAGVVLAAILSVSLVFVGVGSVLFYKRKIQRAPMPDTSSLQVFLEAFALYLVLYVVSGQVLRFFGATSVQWIWITLPILPMVWKWVTMHTTAGELKQAIGWHQGRGVLREVGAGLAGYLAGIPVIAVGCLVTFVLIRYTGMNAASPVIRELKGGPLELLAMFGLACVFAPVMEETMFRGLLFHHLRQRWSWLLSAGIVSFIFAMLHPQGWVAVPALGAIAMVLAGLREWRGSLIAPMAAHACNNFIVLTFAILLLK
jgi:membrane protease YdiL (CAAX protease family)